jgi:tRNA (guanine37-N1)-methyltransferase
MQKIFSRIPNNQSKVRCLDSEEALMRRSYKHQLEEILNTEELSQLQSALEIVGDIALLKLPPTLIPKAAAIGETLLNANKNIKVVLRQASPVSGELRVRALEWVAGEHRTETTHKENGCTLKVNLSQAYFSPRLHYERARVAKLVQPEEIIVNMFAGVGSFSVVIAKKAQPTRVYSIDINPTAVKYLEENASRNRVWGRVTPILGDARNILETTLKGIPADRVLMPLPAKVYKYLPNAVRCLRADTGWIHCYDMIHAAKGENPVAKVEAKASGRLQELDTRFHIDGGRVVRSVGPNWYQAALDIEVHRH